MASAVDICNLALSHLGQEATVSSINPPEGSMEAEHCANFYPVARKTLLESKEWSFATRRSSLALLTVTPPYPWSYAYSLPALALKPIAVKLPAEANPQIDPALLFENIPQPKRNDDQPFISESLSDGSRVIYTNVELAVLVYTVDVTDTTKFTTKFTLALSRLLASFLAGALIKGTTGAEVAEAMRKLAIQEADSAAVSDANASNNARYTTAVPAAINARL